MPGMMRMRVHCVCVVGRRYFSILVATVVGLQGGVLLVGLGRCGSLFGRHGTKGNVLNVERLGQAAIVRSRHNRLTTTGTVVVR
jgi:hypothetical protein